MPVKLSWGFEPIAGVTNHYRSKSILAKGIGLVKSKHLRNAIENTGKHVITSKCLPQTSVNAKEYDVIIQISPLRDFINASCTCKAGLDGKCKHVAATIYFINDVGSKSVSKTSLPQEWGAPTRKKTYKVGSRISQLFPRKRKQDTLILEAPVDVIKKYELGCPMTHALCDEDTAVTQNVRDILKDMVTNVEESVEAEELFSAVEEIYKRIPNLDKTTEDTDLTIKQFYTNNGLVTTEQAKDYVIQTIKQSESSLWFALRMPRVSSSRAHSIFCRKGNYETLAFHLITLDSFNGPSVRYGRTMEPIARRKFNMTNNLTSLQAGLFICPGINWLCASPDGLITEIDGTYSLLEIKCPFKCENMEIIDFLKNESRVTYLQLVEGQVQLKLSHKYHTHIQIAMHCVGANRCYFYVYSSKQQIQLEIPKADSFIPNCITVLRQFYLDYYLPVLINMFC